MSQYQNGRRLDERLSDRTGSPRDSRSQVSGARATGKFGTYGAEVELFLKARASGEWDKIVAAVKRIRRDYPGVSVVELQSALPYNDVLIARAAKE